MLLLPSAASAACRPNDIVLLEPVPFLGKCIPVTGGFGPIFTYVNALYPWLVGTAAGITLFWALFGGLQMIDSGGDQNKFGEGKKKIIHAILGLVIIVFSSLIMHILNPTFYR